MVHPFTDGVSIEVETFVTSCSPGFKKLDLLFYNNVNRAGQVLTSLVYNSGVRDAQDTSRLHYEPNKLYKNTDIEMSYIIVGDEKLWANSDLITLTEDLIKDNSYDADRTAVPFSLRNDFAVTKVVGDNVYDGWYTVVSVGLTEWADGDVVPEGVLRYNPTESRAEYYGENGDWISINRINAENTLIEVFNTGGTCVYKNHYTGSTEINSFDLSDLQAGLYFVRLKNKDEVYFQKIIKK